MTGGRAPRDAWRGVRDTERGAKRPATGEPTGGASGRVELEELPAQTVMPQGGPRLGVGGTVAVLGLAVLLAAGFGALGGRPDSSPAPPAARTATAPVGTAERLPTPIVVVPVVTPWTACGPAGEAAPTIELQVDGKPHAGIVTLAGRAGEPARPYGTLDLGPLPPAEAIVVPVDVVSEIWIDGAVCARAWTIVLLHEDGPPIALDTVVGGDARLALQNRFRLSGLDELDGGLGRLVATLDLERFVVAAEWLIRLEPVPLPDHTLAGEDGPIETVVGCDVTLTLATQSIRALNPCVDDVAAPPIQTGVVGSGERLRFDLGDWSIDDALVFCGRLNGQSFVAAPAPGCQSEARDVDEFEFRAPTGAGRWTLAISACAEHQGSRGPALNRLCGTWYANIEVRAHP